VHCVFDARAPIRVGRDVHIGPGSMLLTSDHIPGPRHRRAGQVGPAEVSIGDGCWLGAQVIVLPGVSIGAGAVVAAGAVVTSSLEGDRVYAGVPARAIRDLEPAEPRAAVEPAA
jgi:acetyltransferase-like isoleucine patch superfamily enzyme